MPATDVTFFEKEDTTANLNTGKRAALLAYDSTKDSLIYYRASDITLRHFLTLDASEVPTREIGNVRIKNNNWVGRSSGSSRIVFGDVALDIYAGTVKIFEWTDTGFQWNGSDEAFLKYQVAGLATDALYINPTGNMTIPFVVKDGDGNIQLFCDIFGTGRRIGVKTNTPAYDFDVNGYVNATRYYVAGSRVDNLMTDLITRCYAEIHSTGMGYVDTVSIPDNTDTKIPFGANGPSKSCTADYSNSRIRITTAGTYKVSFSINAMVSTAPVDLVMRLYANGNYAPNDTGPMKTVPIYSDTGNTATFTIETIITVSANTDIDVRGYHSAGISKTLYLGGGSLSVVRI